MPQTLTLLNENYKEVTYNNGDIPKKLRKKIGIDKDGIIELYFLAYESLERIKKFLSENTVPTITWTPTPDKIFSAGSPTNWSGKYTEDPTKPQKIDFYVESGYRPVGTPDDYKLTEAERLLRFGRSFTQHYAKHLEETGGNKAAPPGTSNHGFGIAIDVYSLSKRATTGTGKTKKCIQSNVIATIAKWDNGNDRFKGYGEWQDCFQAWLYLHGKEYGWIPRLYPSYNPQTKVIEPWHFEYDYKSDIYLNQSQPEKPELVAAKSKKDTVTTPKITPITTPSQQNQATFLTKEIQGLKEDVTTTFKNLFIFK